MADDLGTTELDPIAEAFGTDELTASTESAPDSGSTRESRETDSERLMDPADLPDELKPHWSRMTRAYNQRLSEMRARERDLGDLESKAALVDRFYNDPAYAQQVVINMARQLGYQLTPGTAAGGTQTAQTGVSESAIQAAREALADSPDLAFLAPHIAKVAQAVANQAIAPLKQERQQQQQEQQRQREEQQTAELEQALEALESSAPDWSEHEDAMAELATWLKKALTRTGPLIHPRYGNAMELVYRLTTGDMRATAEAGRRMGRALQNRTTTGASARNPGPSVQEQIAKAKTHQEKVQIAFQDALAQIRR